MNQRSQSKSRRIANLNEMKITYPMVESKFQSTGSQYQLKINTTSPSIKADQDYLQYLRDCFINGRQIKIETGFDWMKDPKDFRYKIYTLLNQIAKNNLKNAQSSHQIQKPNYFEKDNSNNFKILLQQYLEYLLSNCYDSAQNYLKKPQFDSYKELKKLFKTLSDKLISYEQTNKDVKIQTEKIKKCQFYEKYFTLSYRPQSLVQLISSSQYYSILNQQIRDKLNSLTTKINHYQKMSNQNYSNKWLKYFLAIITQEFNSKEVKQLQEFVNQDSCNKQLKQTMANLKIFCLNKMNQYKFYNLINDLKIQNQETIKAIDTLLNSMVESLSKRQNIKLFQNQTAIQILQKYNKTISRKYQSFSKQICKKYFDMRNHNQQEKTNYFRIMTQKEISELFQINKKLDEIKNIVIGKKQNSKRYSYQTTQSHIKLSLSEEINKSVDGILDHLKSGQNFLQRHTIISTVSSNNSSSVTSASNSAIYRQSNLNNEQKMSKQIDYCQQIQNLISQFKQKLNCINQINPKKPKVSFYQIESFYFDSFITSLTKIINKLKDKTTPVSSSQNLINQVNSNLPKSKIISIKNPNSHGFQYSQQKIKLQQQLKNRQLYLKIQIQTNNKLREQRDGYLNKFINFQKKYQQSKEEVQRLKKQSENFERFATQTQTTISNSILKIKQQQKEILDLRQRQFKITSYQNQNNSLLQELDELKLQIKNNQDVIQSQRKELLAFQQKQKVKIKLIQQKTSLLGVKEEEKTILQQKVLELQKNIQQKQLYIYDINSKLKQKQNLLQGFVKYSENQQNTNKQEAKKNKQLREQLQNKVKELQEQLAKKNKEFQEQLKKKNQLQQEQLAKNNQSFQKQCQKLASQKRVPNFKSFNSNTRQKSIRKAHQPVQQVNSPKLKGSQLKLNAIKIENHDKKQTKNQMQIEKQGFKTQKEQRIQNDKLKLQQKVFIQSYIPKLNLNNQESVTNQLIDSHQYKDQQLKQKQFKIDKMNQQIQVLKNEVTKLSKHIEEISKKSLQNEEQYKQLVKSNRNLREQKIHFITSQNQIKKLKKQKETVQLKLKQIIEEFQKYKSNSQEKRQIQSDSNQLKEIKQTLTQKCNQINKLQKTITDLSQQVGNLKKDKLNLQKTIQDLQKKQKEAPQITTSKSQIKSTGNQKNKNEQNNAQLQAYKKQMKVKILQLELDLDQKQQNYQELKEKHKKQITALKNQIQTLTSSTPGLQSEISNLKNELLKKSQTLNNKQKEVQNLLAKITEFQTLKEKRNEEMKRIEEQIKDLRKQNESMERQLTKLCDGRDKLESENNSLIDKYRNQQKLHKEEIDKMKKDQAAQIRNLKLENARQVQQIRRQIKSAQYSQRIKANTEKQGESNVLIKMEHEKLKRQFESLQKSNKEMQQVIKDLEINLKSLQNTLSQKEQQIKKLQDKNRQLQQLMRQLEKKLAPMKGGIKQISTIIFDRFFQNEALCQQFYKKYLLYDLIQLQTKKSIKSTTLLYRLDKLNKINFHEYVDCKNNVVAIIKTSNGNIFGGFSTSKIEKGYRQPAGTVSFIFTFDSLNTIEHFTLDEKKKLNLKSFDWDEYFFVFGNAEIRWRFGERKIYSNFAINNGYYETKGKDVSALLQQGSSRETAIVALDFYQVQFEQ